jgi:molybdate transport system ATP-binding protein
MIKADIIKRLHGNAGDFQLEINLHIQQGQFIALYGPSGVGKTTLLRCLAGLEKPDEGQLVVENEIWFDQASRIHLPPQQRYIGYMFQDYALFPNMTVRGNIAFAIRKNGAKNRVDDLLDMMDLTHLQHIKPATLSGGQKQRVALARTLASEPKLLLLDEPFSALDADLRMRLQDEILRLQRHFGLTAIIVSHDVGEVYKLADTVVILEAGKIISEGKPADVFSVGQTSGKFKFIGEILAIEPMDVMCSLTVLVGSQIVRVVTMKSEAQTLNIGNKVMLVSKAFNPMVFNIL